MMHPRQASRAFLSCDIHRTMQDADDLNRIVLYPIEDEPLAVHKDADVVGNVGSFDSKPRLPA
jgi:hypothetical protein